jgi:hypothetical protein
LLFYLYHFGYLEFKDNFEDIISKLQTKQVKEETLWAKLKPYIFPEIGGQLKFSGAKSISKKFLKTISKSRNFVKSLLNLVVDLMMFLGYCWKIKWGQIPENQYDKMDLFGIEMLKKIGYVNRNEIGKLFTEWNNLVTKTSNEKSESYSTDQKFKIIQNSVKRINFKFPWTFKEVHIGIIYTFLSITEYINYDYLPKNSESKIFIKKKFLV